MDVRQGTPFAHRLRYAGTYEGRGGFGYRNYYVQASRKAGQSGIDLEQTNVDII